jgi:serine/threonine-protein kinase
MELLQGKTLAEVLDERGPLTLDTACEIVIQACGAVAAAHAAGIVHRDLKPENLFLSGANLSFVKILDFGVSKFDSVTTGVQGLTLEGSPIGTPYYMSPEQVRGEKSIDARADVYALGVLFYECLTGRKPFVAETLPHLAVLIHQGHYSPPSGLRPGLPAAADIVVSRAMASNRSERYASAQEFSEAVAHLRGSTHPAALGQTQPLITDEQRPARPTPALTPAVFTAASTPAPARSSRVWLFAVLGVMAIGAIAGISLMGKRPSQPAVAESTALGSSAPPRAASTAAATPAPTIVVVEVPASAVAPSASAAPPRTAATAGAAATAARPTPSAAPAASNRSRASSYGLAEDNPF